MPKFKGLVEKQRENAEYQEEQKSLREKHHIENEDVVVVEKDNMAKFSIRTMGNLIRILATIVILCLAAIGLTAIIYPEAREALLAIFQSAAEQTSEMIP